MTYLVNYLMNNNMLIWIKYLINDNIPNGKKYLVE